MHVIQTMKSAVVALACAGVLVSSNPVSAAAPIRKIQKSGDIALTEGGALVGQVVDSQGQGLDGAAVTVSQGNKAVARTVANKNGYFSVNDLRGGTFTVRAANGEKTYRLWTAKSAPPSAKSRALLVSENQIVRGQGIDAITGTTVILSAVAAGFSIAAYKESRDSKEASEEARDIARDLQEQVDDIAASLN